MPTYNPVGIPCDSVVSVSSLSSSLSARCWPNPLSDLLYIAHSENEELKLRLYDVSGRVQLERRIARGIQSVETPVGALPEGLYFLMLRSADERLYA